MISLKGIISPQMEVDVFPAGTGRGAVGGDLSVQVCASGAKDTVTAVSKRLRQPPLAVSDECTGVSWFACFIEVPEGIRTHATEWHLCRSRVDS